LKTIKIKFEGVNDIKDFVAIITKYPYDLDIRSSRYIVDAKSILGILSLNSKATVYLDIHSANCDDLLKDIEGYLI